ncbi:MAG TPA: glycosyltransferase family 39 protein [Candidatus Hydrogenedentes bacterium]|nr:glycosyltransferase family 39 protein [Candidatus Hydrogenedentota bacterium]
MDASESDAKILVRDLCLCVAAAFLCRALFAIAMPRVLDSADAIHYVSLAEDYAKGQWKTLGPRIPPLYPALGALMRPAAPDMEWALRWVSLVASSLLPIPVYLLARMLHGSATARIAASMVAIWPWLIDYGTRVGPEALASLLWFTAIYALARALLDGGPWTFAAPVAFFALHLARPEGTFLLLAAPIAATFLCARNGEGRWKRLLPFLVISTVLLTIYAAYLKTVTGSFALSGRAPDLGGALAHALLNRGEQTVRAFNTLMGNVIPVMLGPYVLLFIGVGLFTPSPQRNFRLEGFVLFFACLQWALATLSTFAEPRYMMSFLIVAYIWGARGFAIVTQRAAASPRFRALRAAPLTIYALIMLHGMAFTLLPEHFGHLPLDPREYKTAGLWMRANLEPGLILTRKPQIGYYAHMPTQGPDAKASLTDILRDARATQARYIVVDERYTANMIPALRPLLDPAHAPPGLRLVRADLSPYPNARIVIYTWESETAP